MNRRPLQRSNASKKPDNNRKTGQTKSATSGKPAKKGSTSAPTPRRKTTANGNSNDPSQTKEEDSKEEEPAEEEKKFEAQNHMEGDLVDILGKYEFYRPMRSSRKISD